MATIIEGVASVKAKNRLRTEGALKLSVKAGQAALERAGRGPSDVGLLVNAGLYRDDNLGEPAMAALIQEDLGIALGNLPLNGSGAFSFDLANGAVGALNSIAVVSGFLETGAIDVGLVVAGDSDPDPMFNKNIEFTNMAGAAVLGWDDSEAGFGEFIFRTFSEFEPLFEARLEWSKHAVPTPPLVPSGKNVITVTEIPGYVEQSIECAYQTAMDYLSAQGLTAADVDLLIAAHPDPRVADAVGQRMGLAWDRINHLDESSHGAHTAAPLVALESAVAKGRLLRADTALVVAAGSGITVGACLYRP
ncbi:MAG: hypothetical protein KDB86_01555 [Actinobacteria bacterium]|nr:hypothetical protein [Actinomycetota bacterium]MCB9390799.1 hypothetical protein [Acidimicrobiia bacterium]